MKKVILSVAIVAMGFSFTSCKKCGKCVYENENQYDNEGEICQKDNKVFYDLVKKSCKNTPGAKWQ